MPQARTSYGGGGVTTETSGAPVQHESGDLSGVLATLFANKLAALDRARTPPPQPIAAAPMRAMAADRLTPAPAERDSGKSAIDQQLEYAAKRDALLQMQARQNPAPMRMVTGPGIIPGYVQDTNAMNAYQRQAYLPQGSSASYSPGSELGARRGALSDAAFDAKMGLDRARTNRATGGSFEY